MKLYTDLILEASKDIPVPNARHFKDGSIIYSSNAIDCLHFSPGKYVTIFCKNNNAYIKWIERYIAKFAKELSEKIFPILVCGIGNTNYIVDSLGNYACEKISIRKNLIYTLTPNVSSQTGIESADLIKAVINYAKPSLVILIDSIATKDLEKLCNCYQLTTAGISPGGGINNSKNILNRKTLGVPILSIGYPVILSSKIGYTTPYNIDDLIKTASANIAKAINNFTIHV